MRACVIRPRRSIFCEVRIDLAPQHRNVARGRDLRLRDPPETPIAVMVAGARDALLVKRGGRGLRSMETCASAGEAEGGYKRPPKEISDIIDSPAQPLLSIAPNRQRIMQLPRPPPYPPVQELARPELKLAGVRIDADIWARSRGGYYTDITFTDLDTVVPTEDEGAVVRLKGLPDGNWWFSLASWAPDSQHVAFTIRSPGGPQDGPRQPHELWVVSPYTGVARCLLASPSQGLNTVFESYEWVDDDTLVATVLPEGLSELPQKPAMPPGPRVQDNSTGRTAQNRTYQDLLKTQHDEDLFEYYGTSELVKVKLSTGDVKRIGPARMYTAVAPSPDGQYLLVRWLERPFSFAVPCGRFPAVVQVWTRDGEFVREVARFPLAEDIPIAFNSVRDGPRSVGWRDDKPAELHWIEPQDGGDAGRSASPRDIVYTLDLQAGDAAAPQELARTDNRCGGVAWCDDDLALVYESWWKSRRSIISMVTPGDRAQAAEVLFDRSYEDVYNDPGSPASRRTPLGTHVIAKMGGRRELLMQGMGASPQGNRPFLDVLDLDSRETRRIWQSSEPFYESTSSILSDLDGKDVELEGLQMLSMRESVCDPPQFYLKTFRADGSFEERCMTDYPHPYPSIRDLQKELIRYERSDGVQLTGTLYLPPGYDQEKEGPLPCLLWAYPREYKSKEAAGQLRRSPYEFSGISGTSPLLWLARRYAVLSGPSMPIVAEGDEEPNDTYISQLTSSAQAAVEELERRGVAQRGRVVVGGHSYGAFMTANLLAHTGDLFAAGIAMSGAYNRTLTPFGFQAEERTLWQATDTYINMSPYLQADKIKRPMLLVHGEDDTNPGTFTLQSERMYSALQGHGGTCRLVVLPHEAHSYRAYESVMHALYEMDAWITQYCGHSS